MGSSHMYLYGVNTIYMDMYMNMYESLFLDSSQS